MTPRGRGTIIFTGATASVRGREGFAAFAAAKHGLRAVAQSMARELGPKGVHVAHTIIDGAIDTAWIAENFPERYALKDAGRDPQPRPHRRRLLGACTSSRATPGPTNWTCGPGWRPGDADGQDASGVPVRFRQPGQLPRLQATAGAGRSGPARAIDYVTDAAGRRCSRRPATPRRRAIPAKGALDRVPTSRRWAKRYGTEFNRNPHFPINTLHLMRGATGLIDDTRFMAYCDLVFDAMWREPKNLGDPAELIPVLRRAGLEPDDFRALIEREDVKERLKATTEAAVARGVFGAPTFFVGEEMFFGQDRMDFVEEALRSARRLETLGASFPPRFARVGAWNCAHDLAFTAQARLVNRDETQCRARLLLRLNRGPNGPHKSPKAVAFGDGRIVQLRRIV